MLSAEDLAKLLLSGQLQSDALAALKVLPPSTSNAAAPAAGDGDTYHTLNAARPGGCHNGSSGGASAMEAAPGHAAPCTSAEAAAVAVTAAAAARARVGAAGLEGIAAADLTALIDAAPSCASGTRPRDRGRGGAASPASQSNFRKMRGSSRRDSGSSGGVGESWSHAAESGGELEESGSMSDLALGASPESLQGDADKPTESRVASPDESPAMPRVLFPGLADAALVRGKQADKQQQQQQQLPSPTGGSTGVAVPFGRSIDAVLSEIEKGAETQFQDTPVVVMSFHQGSQQQHHQQHQQKNQQQQQHQHHHHHWQQQQQLQQQQQQQHETPMTMTMAAAAPTQCQEPLWAQFFDSDELFGCGSLPTPRPHPPTTSGPACPLKRKERGEVQTSRAAAVPPATAVVPTSGLSLPKQASKRQAVECAPHQPDVSNAPLQQHHQHQQYHHQQHQRTPQLQQYHLQPQQQQPQQQQQHTTPCSCPDGSAGAMCSGNHAPCSTTNQSACIPQQPQPAWASSHAPAPSIGPPAAPCSCCPSNYVSPTPVLQQHQQMHQKHQEPYYQQQKQEQPPQQFHHQHPQSHQQHHQHQHQQYSHHSPQQQQLLYQHQQPSWNQQVVHTQPLTQHQQYQPPQKTPATPTYLSSPHGSHSGLQVPAPAPVGYAESPQPGHPHQLPATPYPAHLVYQLPQPAVAALPVVAAPAASSAAPTASSVFPSAHACSGTPQHAPVLLPAQPTAANTMAAPSVGQYPSRVQHYQGAMAAASHGGRGQLRLELPTSSSLIGNPSPSPAGATSAAHTLLSPGHVPAVHTQQQQQQVAPAVAAAALAPVASLPTGQVPGTAYTMVPTAVAPVGMPAPAALLPNCHSQSVQQLQPLQQQQQPTVLPLPQDTSPTMPPLTTPAAAVAVATADPSHSSGASVSGAGSAPSSASGAAVTAGAAASPSATANTRLGASATTASAATASSLEASASRQGPSSNSPSGSSTHPRSSAACSDAAAYAAREYRERVSQKQKRGMAMDSQSVAARKRREKISSRIRRLQGVIPGANRLDTATLLDRSVDYVAFLEREVKRLAQARGESILGSFLSTCASGSEGVVIAGPPAVTSLSQTGSDPSNYVPPAGAVPVTNAASASGLLVDSAVQGTAAGGGATGNGVQAAQPAGFSTDMHGAPEPAVTMSGLVVDLATQGFGGAVSNSAKAECEGFDLGLEDEACAGAPWDCGDLDF